MSKNSIIEAILGEEVGWVTTEEHLLMLQKAVKNLNSGGYLPEKGTMVMTAEGVAIVFGPNESKNRTTPRTETGAPFYGLDKDTVLARIYDKELEMVAIPGACCVPITNPTVEQETQAKLIRSLITLLEEKNKFQPGDVVTWKPGLRNCRQSGVMVIARNITPVLTSDMENNRRGEGEILDVLVASTIKDGIFMHALDSRRLMPVTVEAISEPKA